MENEHQQQLEAWREKYQQSNSEREASIDSIARGMAELASASGAPASTPNMAFAPLTGANQTATEHQALPAAVAVTGPLIEITDTDQAKCTNCKTCYQDLSELFEKNKIVVDGETREVGRVIPGVLETTKLTPELISHASRVADDCDAEIIRFHKPD
jgi:pyruvate-ferredoxin/flavodoxin oxidoreductase